ncbi:MAG: hypothetical protein M1818_005284 [Claussenomyces sp. TS43310]|nr:MAG: hypothetical protein M1818_005284 [Claussenomyces sp. TS43310]
MSSQKILDLVAGMRKAVKRAADESDSDDSIDLVTNRGNKLRKKAKYVQEGQLAPPRGPRAYKKTIKFGDEQYPRDIISRNPTLYDEDGDEVDIEDDDERAHAAVVAAAEFYPYADVRIEYLLAPLTAASDLPNHPTLSRPFTSTTLTELTRNARDMVQKERASLWRMKHLLTKLSGDHSWIPCEMMETRDDIALFGDGRELYREHLLLKSPLKDDEMPANSSLAGQSTTTAAPIIEGPAAVESGGGKRLRGLDEPAAQDDGDMIEAAKRSPLLGLSQPNVNKFTLEEEQKEDPTTKNSHHDQGPYIDPDETLVEEEEEGLGDKAQSLATNGTLATTDQGLPAEDPAKSLGEIGLGDAGDVMEGDELPATHRMRTRAQAHAASDNNTIRTRSMTPESNESYIHPYFLAPPSARPDRDLGLPPGEADETRRLLQLYIQKQEEVCRGSEKVYNGLLRAERLRKTVMKWAKAEGHLNEMSDGEDWYDKEEWGLTEELKKGQDEEEEDAATTAKKTRTRRQ